MKYPQRHILVTGAPRTGTTFLGQVLAMPADVGYVSEPFNAQFGLRNLDNQFAYLYSGMPDEERYYKMIEELASGKAPFRRLPVKEARSPRQRIGRAVLGGGSGYDYWRAKHNPLVKRFLFKDPLACFSAEYLHQEFDMDIVVIVRHPIPTIASMRRVHVDHKITDLTSNKALFNRFLAPIYEDVKIEKLSQLERRALLWASCYRVLHTYAARNPRIIVVRHMDLSARPLEVTKALYDQLGLMYTPAIEQKVIGMTAAGNPARIKSDKMHVLKRDSRELLNAKYYKFEPGEERRIHALTDCVTQLFYPSTAWPQPVWPDTLAKAPLPEYVASMQALNVVR